MSEWNILCNKGLAVVTESTYLLSVGHDRVSSSPISQMNELQITALSDVLTCAALCIIYRDIYSSKQESSWLLLHICATSSSGVFGGCENWKELLHANQRVLRKRGEGSDGYEEYYFIGCETVQFCRSSLMFRRNILPLFSGPNCLLRISLIAFLRNVGEIC